MGFGNGYDSGYSDAIEDVRNGKVAGLGPASGDGSGSSQPTRGPGVFTLSDAVDNGAPEMDYEVVISPVISPDSGAIDRLFPVVSGSISNNVFTISPPEGGWTPGDMLLFFVSAGEGAILPEIDNDNVVAVGQMQAIVRGETGWMPAGFTMNYVDLV